MDARLEVRQDQWVNAIRVIDRGWCEYMQSVTRESLHTAPEGLGETERLNTGKDEQHPIGHSIPGLFSASELPVEVSQRARQIGKRCLSLDLLQKFGVTTKHLKRSASLDQSAMDAASRIQD